MKARSILIFILTLGVLPFLTGGRPADNADEDYLQCRIREVGEMLGVTIITDQPVRDSWGAISYRTPTEDDELLKYLELVAREFSKYPEGYLRQSHAHTHVLEIGRAPSRERV